MGGLRVDSGQYCAKSRVLQKYEPARSQAATQRIMVSARELEVVQLIAQGLRNKEIADKLFITEQTVKNHLHVIFGKLGLSDRSSLALYAIHDGLYADNSLPPVALPLDRHSAHHNRVASLDEHSQVRGKSGLPGAISRTNKGYRSIHRCRDRNDPESISTK